MTAQQNTSLVQITNEVNDNTFNIQQLISQLEALLKTTEKGSNLYQELSHYLEQLMPFITNEELGLTSKSKELLIKGNAFVQQNPLKSMAIVAGAGVLLTLLANRKK